MKETTLLHACFLFSVLATGEPFPDDAVYVGTFHESYYVWHVVEHK